MDFLDRGYSDFNILEVLKRENVFLPGTGRDFEERSNVQAPFALTKIKDGPTILASVNTNSDKKSFSLSHIIIYGRG